MDKKFYKIFLHFLKSLIYFKRSVFWLLKFIWKFLLFINNIYKSSLGFVIFRTLFYTKKYFNKLKFFKKESKIEFFGRRGTLQILFLVMFFIIMIPHTHLYTKSFGEVSGKNSLLYQVIEHGNQDFTEEEVLALNIAIPNATNNNDWKSGSVSSEDLKNITNQNDVGDLGSVTVGGTAVTKPTIIPGSESNNTTSNGIPIIKTNRTEIINYTVQVDDVIGEIAKRFGISINTILWANNLTTRSYIQPNQTLIILPMDGVTHKVIKGDTVSKIARIYDADSTQIVKFNKLEKDGADIVVGETLIIPGGEKPTPKVAPALIANRPSSFNKVVPVSSVLAPAGSGYLWPTDAKIITQYFGLTHNALDIAAPIGTRIYATKAGTVIISQCGWNGGYGCYIKIDHGNGIISLYGHNSKLLVNVGDYVVQGQNISLMGSTGHSSGPHTHFEIRVNGKNVNPLSYVRKP
ncbi:MAG: hypothetical protein COY69_00520 [Candidatus Magasanikbacteria bacterium CG_4_10_14_0_8_um_filter_32_14]|uniref:LysM domain-containing protein n=1 Tax=Candidatus Magasanikbacteria bacterium CG_4_10_14_0_8_um_filter_32_14 TaxID=1974640 RepID=A0A2M7RA48_9BACT|nr:MAG: hypothetical protein COY69_00520 [Candidatus Magasanikbacteria bacterium CG_4_10_14_0_8_um_filter_32_14]